MWAPGTLFFRPKRRRSFVAFPDWLANEQLPPAQYTSCASGRVRSAVEAVRPGDQRIVTWTELGTSTGFSLTGATRRSRSARGLAPLTRPSPSSPARVWWHQSVAATHVQKIFDGLGLRGFADYSRYAAVRRLTVDCYACQHDRYILSALARCTSHRVAVGDRTRRRPGGQRPRPTLAVAHAPCREARRPDGPRSGHDRRCSGRVAGRVSGGGASLGRVGVGRVAAAAAIAREWISSAGLR